MESSENISDYIDVDDALSRIGGNMGLYKKLLARFLEGNHFEAVEGALNSGDLSEASQLAHTLKGVSANLSLKKINLLTVDLEQLLKSNSDYSSCLEELKQAYAVTTEKIMEMTGSI